MFNRGGKVVANGWYRGVEVARMLQMCVNSGVIVVLQGCYRGVPGVKQGWTRARGVI